MQSVAAEGVSWSLNCVFFYLVLYNTIVTIPDIILENTQGLQTLVRVPGWE